mgnify:CR=1 FL=1
MHSMETFTVTALKRARIEGAGLPLGQDCVSAPRLVRDFRHRSVWSGALDVSDGPNLYDERRVDVFLEFARNLFASEHFRG